jgi:hypothetical protein
MFIIHKKSNGIFTHIEDYQTIGTTYSDFDCVIDGDKNTFILHFENAAPVPRVPIPVSDVKIKVGSGVLESFNNALSLENRLVELFYPPFLESNTSFAGGVSNYFDGFKIGDRKQIDKADIVYFTTSGIGFGKHLGWAIDEDKRRRVSVGYDPTTYSGSGNDYSILGNKFGKESVVLLKPNLPKESLKMFSNNINGTSGEIVNEENDVCRGAINSGGLDYEMRRAGGSGNDAIYGNTSKMGDDVAHENTQPSIVELWIKKINNQSGVVDPLILPEAILRGVYDPLVNGTLGVIYVDSVTGFQYVWLGIGYSQLGVGSSTVSETKTQLVNCVTGVQTYPLDLPVLAKAVFLDGSILYEQNNDYTTVNGSITILTTNYPPIETGSKLLIFL